MPRRCSIQGCSSNYDHGKEKFYVFSLPSDEELRKRWLLNIPTDFNIKYPGVCEKHFSENEIIRIDKVMYQGVFKEFPRSIPILKKDAIPTIFPNLPCLPTCQIVPKEHVDVKVEAFENGMEEDFFECEQNIENISSLKDIQYHLQNNRGLPKRNCTYLIDDERITILFVVHQEGCPVLLSSIVIENNLEVYVYSNKENDILPEKTTIVKDTNFLDNLMNFVEIHSF